MSNRNQPLVYFFAKSNFGDTQPDFIKIGYTTDLSGRQANLQTGSESRIWEIGVIPFETEDEARGEEGDYMSGSADSGLTGNGFMLRLG